MDTCLRRHLRRNWDRLSNSAHPGLDPGSRAARPEVLKKIPAFAGMSEVLGPSPAKERSPWRAQRVRGVQHAISRLRSGEVFALSI